MRRAELVTLRPSHAVLRLGAVSVGQRPWHRPGVRPVLGALTLRAVPGKVKWLGQVIQGMIRFTMVIGGAKRRFTPSGEAVSEEWRLE